MLRTLAHHWRVNLAVALGAAVACTVLTGALLVGDSVRGSLRDLTLDRLGGIDQALVSQHFFREALAGDLTRASGFLDAFAEPVPAILLRGTGTHADSGARASRVGIHGVDERFAALFGAELDFERREGQIFPSVVINETLRGELQAQPGDAVLLSFGRKSDIPRESLMGDKDLDDVLGTVRGTVSAVIADRGMGRFGLTPTQQGQPNAFLALETLQRALDRRGEVNAILVSGRDATGVILPKALNMLVGIEDLGLVLRRHDDHFTLESREFVLPPGVTAAAARAAEDLEAHILPTQSYVANEIRAGERSIPYSMITALDALNNGLPWATLTLVDGGRSSGPAADGVLLNRWAADDLGVGVGDLVEIAYFEVDSREELSEKTVSLRVEGVVAMEGLGADRNLTPEYPGIQDAEDISAWDPPFPVELERIRTEDELYWDRYGATPKAFVSSATGRRLWTTRFGSTTSVLIGFPAGADPDQTDVQLRKRIAGILSPAAFGLSFRAVKEQGLHAATGATDFSMLFLSFSMFLIASAAMLIGLLFRLGVERRAAEIGLLLAVGYRLGRVRRRLLAEGALLAACGGLLGLVGAVGFAGLMMLGLRTIWRPAVGSSELFLHVEPVSLAIGWSSTIVVVLLSVFYAVRRLIRIPAPQLLQAVVSLPQRRRSGVPSLALAWGGLVAAIALVGVAVATGSLQSPGLAFGTGTLLLIAGLAFFSRWCRGARRRRLASARIGMAARNSAWNPGRSILSVALVGAASFMVVVVDVFRVVPGEELERLESGAGGFRLVAESDVPLHQNLNRPEDRFELGFADESAVVVDSAKFYQARLLPGDDASCNNLYQPERPTLMGVSPEFVQRGGFRFQQVLDLADGSNPWRALEPLLDDGVVPAIADANSAQWILKVKLGEEFVMDDEQGQPMRLRLIGLLDHSLFRSELIVAEQHLLAHFPSLTGDSHFLIELPADRADEVARLLESRLSAFGFDVTETRDKIAAFEAVQNTYLSTFQVLGGLGLLLGTFGLGIVLVRNVIDRRGELATLRAFGFRSSRLAWIVLIENAFLLAVGVGVGTVAAFAAVFPGLAGRGLPWASLVTTLALVLAVGMLSSVAAVAGTLRVPLLPALKAER